MRRRSARAGDEAEINITPMLDIIFILLIFFIVTTSFVKEFAIGASRPGAHMDERKVSEVIAVRIDRDGQISVNERVVDIRTVRANIEAALAAMPDADVVVIADRSAAAGLLVRVIDQARLAGAANVSLAAQPT